MKIGIHSGDWDKLIEELRNSLEEYTFQNVVAILEKHSTRYLE